MPLISPFFVGNKLINFTINFFTVSYTHQSLEIKKMMQSKSWKW